MGARLHPARVPRGTSPTDPPLAAGYLCLSRPGGTRTPNRRFWRPVLYQLSYGPGSFCPARHPRSGPRHGQGRNRTADTTIFSRVLYQLSYLAIKNRPGLERRGRRRFPEGDPRRYRRSSSARSVGPDQVSATSHPGAVRTRRCTAPRRRRLPAGSNMSTFLPLSGSPRACLARLPARMRGELTGTILRSRSLTRKRRPRRRSVAIAGAGFEPATFGL
jgi:hypothetical protein